VANDRWRTIRRVIDEIASENQGVEFFQLVRLVEASRSRAALLPPGAALKQPVGTSRRLSEEAVRFRAAIAGHFEPASTRPLGEAPRTGSNEPTVIDTNFMAPAGAQGLLPQHYTSLILHRLREEDSSLKDFLDLFHHRLISYFVRGWEKYRHYITYEQALGNNEASSREPLGNGDAFTECIRSLVNRTPHDVSPGFDEAILLHYSGVFSDRRRPADSLTAVLKDYLGVSVAVQQLHPRRMRLLPEHRWSLPGKHNDPRHSQGLGHGVLLGESVLIAQTSFLMRIGPLTLGQFRQHLPDGDRFAPLNRLVRYFVGFEFVFEIQLLLKADEAPPFQLGGSGGGVRLGWETWIGEGTPQAGTFDQVRFVVSS
jgi:type VI secretion system protein ImpH